MPKILIVEDDQFLSKMYAKKFEVTGFEVETAFDGEEGVSKAETVNPDIIIMDVMMPKLNGIEALDKIKANPKTKDIPVLILTNLSGTEDAQTAVKKGAVDFLVKSDFTPVQVVEKINAILKKQIQVKAA